MHYLKCEIQNGEHDEKTTHYQRHFLFYNYTLSIWIAITVWTSLWTTAYTLAFGINYNTYTPPKIIQMDTSKLPPAKGVPILLYHRVTYNYDTTNTQLNIFISQMEMLKRDGYKTISIHDLDLFLQ